MSVPEIGHRIRQKAQASIERAGLVRDALRPVSRAPGKPWVEMPATQFDAAKYTTAADQILAGHFTVFAQANAALGFPPIWNRDLKTGRIAPLIFGKTLDYRDERIVGDIKYLWEPSRHAQLVTLAQAWYLSRNEKYAHGCQVLLDSWFQQCPHRLGVHWTSSLEHAIRLLNWSFAWHLLGAENAPLFSSDAGRAFRDRWMLSVHQHCGFIAAHLSRFSSANNHLLGELCGLFVGAVTWPLWQRSAQWQRSAREEFEEQALLQNGPDGVNREQANWYHYEVAEMMLVAGLVARANDCDFSSEYWQRLCAMLEYVVSIMDYGGHVPNFGDADDAVIARLDPAPDRSVYRSLLATGAVLFQNPAMKLKAGTLIDDKTRWLLGSSADDEYARLDVRLATVPHKRAFDSAGYYILGTHFESPAEIKVVADAGPLGYLSIAAHGHADALSFTLSAAGREILIDPGTYAYHTQKKWRDYFRGTAAHNTVRVDRQDQSVAVGNFLWRRHANANALEFNPSERVQRLVAEHDGYSRLSDSVLHRRELTLDVQTQILTVVDELVCGAEHEVEIFWHFAEDCELALKGKSLTVRSGCVLVQAQMPEALAVEVHRGEESPPLGWISRSFDIRIPSATVRCAGEIRSTTRFVTRFSVAFEQNKPSMSPVTRTAATEVT